MKGRASLVKRVRICTFSNKLLNVQVLVVWFVGKGD